MSQAIVTTLKAVDDFHKNCDLLFHDMMASIRQNTLTETLTELTGGQPWSAVGHPHMSDSEHRGYFVFDHSGRMRFVYMLVKTHENFLRGRSAGFKALCQELKVDALFPLLLLTGVFELRVPGFRVATYVYEEWLNSLLQLRMPDTMQGPAPSTYCLDTLLTIEMQGGNASQWYEKALLKIRQLTDIRDSQAVENIVLELLRL